MHWDGKSAFFWGGGARFGHSFFLPFLLLRTWNFYVFFWFCGRKFLSAAPNKVAINAIVDILRTESTRQKWRRLRSTGIHNLGEAITDLKVPDVAEDRLYATRYHLTQVD